MAPKQFVPRSNTPVETAVESYLRKESSLGRLRPATIRNRRIELGRFARFAVSKKIDHAHEINRNLVTAYIGSLNIGNATKATTVVIIRAFLDYLVEEYLLMDNFLHGMKPPRSFRPEADYLAREEIDALFGAIAENSREKSVDRNLLLFSFLTVLCMRVSEAAGVRLQDVDLKAATIWVHRKGGKLVKLPLNTDLRQKIDTWLEKRKEWPGADSGWLFLSNRGGCLSVRQIQDLTKGFLKSAGILKRNMSPHLLRHSGASFYLATGTDIKTVQNLLGHSNLATTSRYVHAGEKAMEDAINGWGGTASGKQMSKTLIRNSHSGRGDGND